LAGCKAVNRFRLATRRYSEGGKGKGRTMDIHIERDTDIRTRHPEMYEPPMLDEIGGFTALTRFDSAGSTLDRFGFWS
jgi:hypothetical protein